MNIDQIKEIIGNAEDSNLIAAWNYMCDETCSMDSCVYDNDNDTYQMLFGDNIDEAMRAASYGDFTYTDSYCTMNTYGNLDTFSYIWDSNCPIDTDTLADFFLEREDELSDYFDFDPDEYEDEEEDEDDDEDENENED